MPKIALWRRDVRGEVADLLEEYVVALASDENLMIDRPLLDINQPVKVADFIEKWLRNGQ